MRTKPHWIVWPLVLTATAPWASAQNQTTQIQDLRDKVTQLETKVQDLQTGRAETDESFDELDSQLLGLTGEIEHAKAGKRKFLLTGLADAKFEVAEGSNSTFNADFNPIFLWLLDENTLVAGEIELELPGGETEVNLEFLELAYTVNDYMTLVMGKFLNPNNTFIERLHPTWINKLPDKPMAFGSKRMQASYHVGAQLRGAIPVGSSKANYAIYVANGTSLVTGSPSKFGEIDQHNFEDANTGKAIGGRVGWFILPNMEAGYSIEYNSNLTPDGSGVADAAQTLQTLDFNYTGKVAGGTLDGRAQWVFSDVDDVTFDPSGSMGFGPVTLNNTRDGGYLQAAFRPTESENELISNTEVVCRYDAVNLPGGSPQGPDETRVTFGVNYWTAPNSVFKVAYRIDNMDGAGADSDALLFQWGVGF